MTQAFEATQSELATLKKRLADTEELLQSRKKRKNGNRLALQGKFVFTTEEVLQIARQADHGKKDKKSCRELHSRAKTFIIQEGKENNIKSVSSDSGSDCIVVASNR